MLQLRALNRQALRRLERESPFPPAWTTMPQLEALGDAWLARLREARRVEASSAPRLARTLERFDRHLLSDTVELLDRDEVSDTRKLRMVRALARQNHALLSHHRFLATIEPHVRAIARRFGRPARLLELASGAGEFSLACAAHARDRRLPLEVSGSDIVEAYVASANAAAKQRNIPASFRRLNAFDLSELGPETYDIVFISQSMHHFSGGQLAMMMAQAQRVATTAFVGVDGRRSLLLLGVVPLLAALQGTLDLVHDATLSARKFYSEAELELIARIALPGATVRARSAHPGFSVLNASFRTPRP
ncbi:MAG: methyltransferase domain-containing protein [Myxococcota bacterium]